MPGLRAKRMKGLRIDEASGVDAPAHLAPGWMVMKSADGVITTDPLADLTDEQIEALTKAFEADEGEPVDELIATLTKALDTMPDAAKAQASALIGALGGDGGGKNAGDNPVAKAVADALTKAQADAAAAEKRATEAEEALAKAKGGDQPETEEEALAKAMLTLPEPVRKQWEADRSKLAETERVAKEERDARLSSEYLAKAKGDPYAGLVVKAETLGTVLREVDEKLSKEAAAEVDRVLKSAAELVTQARRSGDPFTARGGIGADASGAAGAQAQIEKAADELMAKDPDLDRSTAITKAADANPDLVRIAQEESR